MHNNTFYLRNNKLAGPSFTQRRSEWCVRYFRLLTVRSLLTSGWSRPVVPKLTGDRRVIAQPPILENHSF